MEASYLTFSIRWRGQVYGFVPNRNFWLLVGFGLVSMSYWALLLWQEHQEMRSQLNPSIHQLLSSIQSVEKGTETNEFAGGILLAISALLNLVLRKLINFSLKVNNTMLISQSKFTAFQQRPIALRLGGKEVSFKPSNKFWYGMLGSFALVLSTVIYLHASNTAMQAKIDKMEAAMMKEGENFNSWFASQNYKEDVMGYFLEYFNAYDKNQQSIQQNYREAFLIQKQLITTQYLIKEKVSRIEQLSDEGLLEMNNKIAHFFQILILGKQAMEPHVRTYFTDTTDLHKTVTALTEQAKYHVPASIKLAQSALETAYGRRVVNNNYFGIKDKSHKSSYMETTEYYNEREMKLNKHKILSMQKVQKGGKTLYKCKVRDSFMDYNTPWKSFREHSLYLVNNQRYAPLFTKGKDYQAWAEKIGSTKYGGVGYATSPVYGNLLKKIIKRYNLDLLDY